MNTILDFITEMITRLGVKSPKIFKVIQIISTIGTLILGVPVFLEYIGVAMPEWAIFPFSKITAIVTLVLTYIAGLPVSKEGLAKKAKENNITVEAQELKTLPFTTKQN